MAHLLNEETLAAIRGVAEAAERAARVLAALAAPPGANPELFRAPAVPPTEMPSQEPRPIAPDAPSGWYEVVKCDSLGHEVQKMWWTGAHWAKDGSDGEVSSRQRYNLARAVGWYRASVDGAPLLVWWDGGRWRRGHKEPPLFDSTVQAMTLMGPAAAPGYHAVRREGSYIPTLAYHSSTGWSMTPAGMPIHDVVALLSGRIEI